MTAKRAKPLEPIKLAPIDGVLLPEPWRREPVLPDDPKPLQETDPMPRFGDALGEHALCSGVVAWHQTAPEWAMIVCRKCYFRYSVKIAPAMTWGDLREYLRVTLYPNAHLPIVSGDPC